MATTMYYTPVKLPKLVKLVDSPSTNVYDINYVLGIFIATTDSESELVDWSLAQEQKQNIVMDIINVGNLTEGFETNDNNYYIENVDFEFYNFEAFWTTNIFNHPRCEIRLVLYTPFSMTGGANLYNINPIFWGVLDYDTYSFEDLVDPSSANYTKFRKYKITAFSFFKAMKDIPVSTLRTKIEDLITAGTITPYSTRTGIMNARTYDFGSTWTFIKYTDIIRACILLLYNVQTDVTFNFSSDFEFIDKNHGSTWSTIDEIYVPFYAIGNYLGNPKIYNQMIFDDGTALPAASVMQHEMPKWSYYNLQNVGEVFSDLLKTFNLVWRYVFTTKQIGTVSAWQRYYIGGGIYGTGVDYGNKEFTTVLHILPRTSPVATITMNNLKTLTTDYELRQVIDGVKVTTPGLDDYVYPSTAGGNTITKDVRFLVQPKGDNLVPLDFITRYFTHSLFIYDLVGGVVNMRFVNSVKTSFPSSSEYYSDLSMEKTSSAARNALQRCSAIYNYELFYIADKSYNLSATFIEIEGIISGVQSSNYCKPNYAISIGGKLYQITKIEKDFLKLITKLSLNRYRNP